jgi:hypothetical protein
MIIIKYNDPGKYWAVESAKTRDVLGRIYKKRDGMGTFYEYSVFNETKRKFEFRLASLLLSSLCIDIITKYQTGEWT